jgi:Wiskott-Aldrich syndrome protein
VKPTAKKAPEKKSSFFSRLFSGTEEEVIPEISSPSGFRHESHIGWDPTNGFEIKNIPPEWKKLFANVGIKKSELKNPETSKFILETVTAAMMVGAPFIVPTNAGGGL